MIIVIFKKGIQKECKQRILNTAIKNKEDIAKPFTKNSISDNWHNRKTDEISEKFQKKKKKSHLLQANLINAEEIVILRKWKEKKKKKKTSTKQLKKNFIK